VATAGNTTAVIPDAGFYRIGPGIGEDEPSAGAYQRFDAIFSVRASLLTSVGGAKPGDTITDPGGMVWTIIEAKPPVISGTWQLTCLSLAIAGALKESGNLMRPVAGQDVAGRPALSSYNTIASGVTCWVQPLESTAGDTFDRRTMKGRYTAYLASPVAAVQAKDVLVVGGTTYTILTSSKPDRLDKLQELGLELVS
jgi:hypothetical protein